MFRQLAAIGLVAVSICAAGCGQLSSLPAQPPAMVQEDEQSICTEPDEAVVSQVEDEDLGAVGELPLAQDGSETTRTWRGARNRALCYMLKPGVAIQVKKKKKATVVSSCCQPQSLIYARCRSGIETCRLGDTSPVQWFSCARKMSSTTNVPAAGTVMLLDGNAGRKMHTGHPVYVENAQKNGNGTWQLRVSHTNYDRQCHLDQDSIVIYDPAKMTATFQSGPWSGWGRDLKALGFIVR